MTTLCFNLKNEQKIKNGIERFLSKKVASKIANENFFLKEKKSITDPQSIWLKSFLKEFNAFVQLIEHQTFWNVSQTWKAHFY